MHSDPTVGALGEDEILRRILRHVRTGADTLLGPGDDAAVVRAASGSVVATTDTLVEGPDFRLAWTSGYDLGWKAAAVNLADVAAMGARPTALLVALALPNDTRASFVEALADGLRDGCAALAPGCTVAGGDLTTSDTLMVAVTALGDLEGRAPVRRDGAAPGQTVAIAGEMGQAAKGLSVLFERFLAPDGTAMPIDAARLDEGEAGVVSSQLRPSPPVALGPYAAHAGATAMMDVSDGLVRDARRLAGASGVTIDLESALLGADPASALAGGEDHALLAVFPGPDLPPGFRRIGAVRASGADAVLVDGTRYEGREGWDPYRDVDRPGRR